MRALIVAFGLSALICLGLAGERAAAADAELRIVVTNGGVDVADKAQFHLHPAGQHDGPDIAWSGAGGTAQAPAGAYDVQVIFTDGAAHKEIWLDNLRVSGKVEKSVEMNLPVAEASYSVTNGGLNADSNGQFHLRPAGQHDGPEIAWAGSGGTVRVPAAAYDVLVIFEDGAARKEVWLDNQRIVGKVEKTVEIGMPVAELSYVVTNGGADVQGKGQFHLRPAGQHDGPEIAWSGSGGSVRVPAAAYDVLVVFDDGAAHKEIWIDNLGVSGKIEKSVEVNLPVAEASYVVANGGVDVEGKGQFHLRPAGQHDGPEIAWAGSGGTVRVPAGSYDVLVLFDDGAAHKEVWLDNQRIVDKVEKTVEVGAVVAEARIFVTNGGVDVQGKGQFHLRPAGQHDGPEIAWAGSGGSVRVPAGSYDVLVLFDDGAAHKEIWLDNQALKGKVDKSVEMNLPVAQVSYLITNGGVDTQGKGQFHIFPAGHHDGGEVAWAGSGGSVRLAAGTYDVAILYSDRTLSKTKWLDAEQLAGKLDKTVELGLRFAEPTVTVTRAGKDVGDAANVGFIEPSRHEEIASVRSGEVALLEAGAYDIRADLSGRKAGCAARSSRASKA